jgi:ribose transport system substrate-binding protein
MPKGFRIAVVPKGSQHQYWKHVLAGVAKAERDVWQTGRSIKIDLKAPLRNDEVEEQTNIIRSLIKQGVHGIVLAPCDSELLAEPVHAAARAGIPTVVIDSALSSTKIVSFIATDNRRAGMLAADRMAQVLSGRGKVLVLRNLKGSASTEDRETGFIYQLQKSYQGIEVIASDQFAGPTRDTAKAAADGLLARLDPDLRGVFTPNEPTTAGMLMALLSAQKAGKIALVGFDCSDIYLDAVRSGRICGLVVQNPFRMGELGVKTLVEHLQGNTVASRIDTGATLITPENIDSATIQLILEPYKINLPAFS